MRTLFYNTVTVLVLLTIFSCHKQTDKKDTEEPEIVPGEPTLTKKDVIGLYLVTKVELKKASSRTDITQEWFKSYAGDCAKDDITEFKPDSSFIVLDGMAACEESTNDTGTWDVISNTELRLDADTAAIEECSARILRLVNPVYSSAQGDMIFTYTRQ